MKNRSELIPVYYRLADDIKRQIEAGQLRAGDSLPTEGQLGERYGVSRMTVRHGLALLADAGLIESIKGKGSFVTSPRLSQLVIDLRNSGGDDGIPIRYRLLKVKLARDEQGLAAMFGLPAKAKVIQLKRLLYQGEHVVAIEDKSLPYLKGKPLLETQMEYADFPEVVAKHQDSVPVRNDMEITIDNISPEDANLLKVEPGSPTLVIKQVIYSNDNTPLGTSRIICHRERFHLKGTSYPYSGRL
jgi:GntR family transcriptional regulator